MSDGTHFVARLTLLAGKVWDAQQTVKVTNRVLLGDAEKHLSAQTEALEA